MMKETMRRKASDNEYFHQDFHITMDQGILYVGENYGDEAVEKLLTRFTLAYFKPLIAEMKEKGLSPLKEHIDNIYSIEKAPDAVKTALENDTLKVDVAYCPAIRFMKHVGHTPSKWYIETTATVNRVLAEQTGFIFRLLCYDAETGKASYTFEKEERA